MRERIQCPACKRMVKYNELGAVDTDNRPVLTWHYTKPSNGVQCRMAGHSPLDEYYLQQVKENKENV